MGNAFCRDGDMPTDFEVESSLGVKLSGTAGTNEGAEGVDTSEQEEAHFNNDHMSSTSSEVACRSRELDEQQITFAKRAMKFHEGWTKDVEDQLARIFHLHPDQVERIRLEINKNIQERMTDEEQQVEFAKKAIQVYKGWNAKVERDIKRMFRLTEEQLSQVKLRTIESVKKSRKPFQVRWIEEPKQIHDIVIFKETHFSEQVFSTIDDEFSEPKTQKKKGETLEVLFNPGDFGFAFDKEDGRVEKIFKDGQAEKLNIKEGWKITKINGENYSKHLENQIDSKQPNALTFSTQIHYPAFPVFA